MDKDSKDKHKLVLMEEQTWLPSVYLPIGIVAIFPDGCSTMRATSHTRLRARDHYSSSTLTGGKRWSRSKFASHYARGTNGLCECKTDVKSTQIPTWHQMYHVSWSLGLLSETTELRGRPNTEPVDQCTPNAHNPLLYSIVLCVRTRMNRNPLI